MFVTVPNYTLLSLLYEGKYSSVFRAVRRLDKMPVIIKILKDENPSAHLLAEMRHEFTVMNQINSKWVVKCYSLEYVQRRLMLVMEDFQGMSLASVIAKEPLDLRTFLIVSIELALGLGDIHHHYVIHKDIKPDNIIVSRDLREIKITDFGSSTQLTQEIQQIVNPSTIVGTLGYISPEQTGRMNRPIDYRSDIYSLGVLLYELILQRLPFQSKDQLELMHLHIAKRPVPPHEVDSRIPKSISDIIMKCLAKDAEDRYHSAFGLKNDLENCLWQYKTRHHIDPFPIGQYDVFDKFHIPYKLYGREENLETLLSIFDKASREHAEILFVKGYAGIGKSSLVHEVQKPIVEKRGFFISGKFDQFKKNVPYSALIQAFQAFIHQLLSETNENIEQWRQKFLSALGPNAQLIIEVIPQLKLIIGEHSPPPNLDFKSAESRFLFVFARFLESCLTKEHPLVIFIDDLQWADFSSLQFIQFFMNDLTHKHLLFICSYRDNEIDQTHPLIRMIHELKEVRGTIPEIEVNPLTLTSIQMMIHDAFFTPIEETLGLADIVNKKTHGNPFFIIQFLKVLYQQNLLFFDPHAQCWRWDLTAIYNLEVTDNVADLITKKLEGMDPILVSLLKTASAIGHTFDLLTVAHIQKISVIEAASILWKAMQEELIFSKNGIQDFIMQDNELITDQLANSLFFSFQHDRIQQAAYQLIPIEDRPLLHVTIGRTLLRDTQPDKFDEQIITIVNQMNQGIGLITEPKERVELAQLNLQAGEKGRQSHAYSVALQYFKAGVELLLLDSWKSHYQLTFKLYSNLAICEYLTGNQVESVKLFELALNNAKDSEDKSLVYHAQLTININAGKPREAIECGIKALQQLGVHISMYPTPFQMFMERRKLEIRLFFNRIESIASFPILTDKKAHMIANLYNSIVFPSAQMGSVLMEYITLKAMNFIFHSGLSEGSAATIARYGNLLVSELFQQYKKGYRFGKLASSVDRLFPPSDKSLFSSLLIEAYTRRWGEHVKESIIPLKNLERQFFELGFLPGSSLSMMMLFGIMVFKGEQIQSIEEEFNYTFNILKRNGTKGDQMNMSYLFNLCLAIHGDFTHIDKFIENELKKVRESEFPHFECYFVMWAPLGLYYSEKFDMILELAKLIDKFRYNLLGNIGWEIFNFYYPLALAKLCTTPQSIEKYLPTLKYYHKKIKRWAEACPANFEHKYALISAEIARITGYHKQAVKYYEEAMQSARENGYLHEEALAYELCAEFYLYLREISRGSYYLQEAYLTYAAWGGYAKLRLLKKKYSTILIEKHPIINLSLEKILLTTKNEKTASLIPFWTKTLPTTHGGKRFAIPELTSIVNKIIGQIDPHKLADEIIQIIQTQLKPERILLMVVHEDEMQIFSEFQTKEKVIVNENGLIKKKGQQFCAAIIDEVKNTKREIILNDPKRSGSYTSNTYIENYAGGPILGIPLLNQGRLLAIIYIEGEPDSYFRIETLALLTLLLPHMAIALENAFHYEKLKILVEERTYQLNQLHIRFLQQSKMVNIGTLAKGVAHEIQNPLNFIVNFSELSLSSIKDIKKIFLRKQSKQGSNNGKKGAHLHPQHNHISMLPILDDLESLMESILMEGSRTDQIVRRIVDQLRQEESHFVLTNIYQLLETAIAMSYEEYKQEVPLLNVEFDRQYDFSVERIEISAPDINRAIVNILNNAYYGLWQKTVAKNRLNQEFVPKITIMTHNYEDKDILIRIKDNGTGISKKIINKIFDPFFTTKKVEEGVGLGLTFCYNAIVQQHGGDLNVQSIEGEYTEFFITLPIHLDYKR